MLDRFSTSELKDIAHYCQIVAFILGVIVIVCGSISYFARREASARDAAPRHITQQEQNAIAAKLTPFKGQSVLIGVSNPLDSLDVSFSRAIAAPFTMAEWKFDWYGPLYSTPLFTTGVIVMPGVGARSMEAANAIVDTFNGVGVAASNPLSSIHELNIRTYPLPVGGPSATINDSTIVVIVGPKP